MDLHEKRATIKEKYHILRSDQHPNLPRELFDYQVGENFGGEKE